jgi:hypothetical protein
MYRCILLIFNLRYFELLLLQVQALIIAELCQNTAEFTSNRKHAIVIILNVSFFITDSGAKPICNGYTLRVCQ